jgi:hypothetical protein
MATSGPNVDLAVRCWRAMSLHCGFLFIHVPSSGAIDDGGPPKLLLNTGSVDKDVTGLKVT